MDGYFKWFGLPGSVVLTTLMSLLALVLAIIHPTPIRWVCFVAMALSSIGDIFLARFNGLDRIFPNYFVIGAGFFMAAHLFYILCFGMKIRAAETPLFNPGFWTVIIIGIVVTVGLVFLSRSTGNTHTLPLILIYAVIIFSNCAGVFSYAHGQAFRSVSAICVTVAVVSFLLSDLVIGLGIVGNIHRYDNLIWWLYPIGQILLILGV